MADYLPPEIILDILHKLPVRSLLRFTCVCRLWHSLITSPDFVSTYRLSRSTDSLHFLFWNPSSCPQGELYCYQFDLDNVENYKLIECPVKPSDNTYPRVVVVHLGLGLIPRKNDYKVVRLVYAFDFEKSEVRMAPLVEVLALREKAWRRVSAAGVEYFIDGYFWNQCFLNGRAHRVAWEFEAFRSWILLFDMGDEKFRKMKLPESLINVDHKQLFISVTSGMLTLFHDRAESDGNLKTDIWIKTRYNDVKSWSKKYTVDIVGKDGMVLVLTDNNEVLLAVSDGHPPYFCREELILYNPKTHKTKMSGVHIVAYICCFCSYMESLILLNKDSGADSDGGTRMEVKNMS